MAANFRTIYASVSDYEGLCFIIQATVALKLRRNDVTVFQMDFVRVINQGTRSEPLLWYHQIVACMQHTVNQNHDRNRVLKPLLCKTLGWPLLSSLLNLYPMQSIASWHALQFCLSQWYLQTSLSCLYWSFHRFFLAIPYLSVREDLMLCFPWQEIPS